MQYAHIVVLNTLNEDALASGAKLDGISGIVSGSIASLVTLIFGIDFGWAGLIGGGFGSAVFLGSTMRRSRKRAQQLRENEELRKGMAVQFSATLLEIDDSSKLQEWDKIKLEIASSALTESNQRILERELIVKHNISGMIHLSVGNEAATSTKYGAISTKGDITINHGVDSLEHAKALVEINKLRSEMNELKNVHHTNDFQKSDSGNEFDFNNEEFQKELAFEANKRAEAMVRSGNYDFSGWTFKELGDISFDIAEYDVARGHYRSAYKKFTAQGDTEGQGRALNDLGNVARHTGNHDEAKKKFLEALYIGERYNHNATIAASLGNLAIASEGDDAVAYFDQAESTFKKDGDWVGYARQLSNRIITADDISVSKNEEFQKKIKKTIELFDDLGERKAKAMLLYALARLERKMDGPLEEEYLWASHAIYKDLGESIEVARSLVSLSTFFERKEKLDEEKEICLQLVEIYKEIGHQRYEARVLHRLGALARKAGEWKQAENFLNQSLAIWREIGNRRSEALVLAFLGSNAWKQKEFERAKKLFLDVLSICKSIDDVRFESYTYRNLGKNAFSLSNYAAAKDYYLQSLSIVQTLDAKDTEAYNLSCLSHTERKLQSFEQAEIYESQSLELFREIGDRKSEAKSLVNMAVLMGEKQNHHKMIEYFQEAIEIGLLAKPNQAQALFNIGFGFGEMHDWGLAMEYYQQAVEIFSELDGFENEWARCLNGLGYSLLLQNELNKAEEYAREGLVIAKRAENRSLEALLFWTLGEILDAKELNEDARESYTKSADIKREIGEELDQFFIDNDY